MCKRIFFAFADAYKIKTIVTYIFRCFFLLSFINFQGMTDLSFHLLTNLCTYDSALSSFEVSIRMLINSIYLSKSKFIITIQEFSTGGGYTTSMW